MAIQKKSIRLTLQFSVTADESIIPTPDDADEQEYYNRQRRLFQAILSDKERYHSYLLFCLTSSIDSLSWQDWHELLLGDEKTDSKEILAPMIATLSKEDRDFFKRVEEHGVFYENVESAEDCFSTTLESTHVAVEEGNE